MRDDPGPVDRMRTPDDFVELLAAHKDSDERLIEYARNLTPLEVETSTDPKVLRIRRMIYAVQGEIHRMRGFVRLEPLGGRVLYGRMSPDHEVGFEVADFFARKFPGTVIVLGDEKRSWSSLRTESGFLRSRGDGVATALEEIGRLMDVGASEGKGEEEDGVDADGGVTDLWEVHYRSQDEPQKDGRRPFCGRISRRSLKSAGMETERGRGNKRLGDFI
ncbi:MAG TPA: DUF4130 domain-containing protein [Methanothrix sp.]|nr:DUF4130 domain-containing protein [Methanothrix sp.]